MAALHCWLLPCKATARAGAGLEATNGTLPTSIKGPPVPCSGQSLLRWSGHILSGAAHTEVLLGPESQFMFQRSLFPDQAADP